MKKETEITITATHGLCTAICKLKAQVEWIPLNQRDVKRMRGFIPTDVTRITIQDADGGVEMAIGAEGVGRMIYCHAGNKRGVAVRVRR